MEHIQNLMSVQEFAEQMTKHVAIGQNKIYKEGPDGAFLFFGCVV